VNSVTEHRSFQSTMGYIAVEYGTVRRRLRWNTVPQCRWLIAVCHEVEPWTTSSTKVHTCSRSSCSTDSMRSMVDSRTQPCLHTHTHTRILARDPSGNFKK